MTIKSLHQVIAADDGEGKESPQDDEQASVISCDVTLFIRLLEVAREETDSDTELHEMVERCSEQMKAKNKPLTMDDYDMIVPLTHKESQKKETAEALPNHVRFKNDVYSLVQKGKSLDHGGETGKYVSTKAVWYDPKTKKITPD